MKFSSKFFIISNIAIVALFITGASVFAAYDTDKEKLKLIKYPIEELGSCKNFDECKTYCNKDENIPKCLRFDIKNLYSKEDAREAERLLNLMDESGLPGKCQNAVECFSYCESAAHVDECWDYAQRHGLNRGLNLETIRRLAKFTREGGKLPGNCEGAECETYCGTVSHFAECADFGEKVSLMTKEETDVMRKIARSGITETPGNCKTKESCLKYCDNSANAVVCMEFALKAGFISKEDTEAVGKIIPYLKSGGKLPGGCTTKESCDTYCGSETHANECADFAVGAGFMSKEDAEIVRKTGGKGPGNCRSREACDSYCKDEKHIDECVDFAVKAGFISEADAADAKKYKITSGPGNCKSKADCEAFCVLPENQETCFNFAKDHGMISEEDLKNIEQYRNQGPPDFSQVNSEWLVCMEKEMGSAIFGRFKAGKSDRSDFPAVQTAQKKCESAMGPDTKECLAKPTCEEFVLCLNPSGSRTSQQKGPERESPPELKKRMDSCQDELKETKKKEIDEKMDACLSRSCSEFDACIKSVQQSSSGEQQSGQQDQGTPNPKLNAKIDACQKEKINACLAKSCGEFQSCINSLGGGGGGGQQKGTPDPAVQAKFQSCQPKQKEGSGGQQQQQGGDQSQIPQGYSSWEAFCRAQIDDSRCSAYKPQIPQQYPLLLRYPPLAAILNFLLGR